MAKKLKIKLFQIIKLKNRFKIVKKIVFVTGTRADYGKIKSILKISQKLKKFKIFLFITGMHNVKMLGLTAMMRFLKIK